MKAQRDEYIVPEIEILDVTVESGFDNSIENPKENDEIEW